MSDQVAVVTGASSGIGAATAIALAREGYAVALAARREDRINQICEDISSGGGRALAVPTDIGSEDEARALIEMAKSELGGVDVLVNNAGVMLLGPVQGADVDEWRQMIDVNVLGLLYATHAAIPAMQERGGGHIVNLSSVAGRTARAGAAVYNLTKWGVGAFSEALRQEVLHSNIRVTIIEPGFVDTELQGHNTNPMVVEGIKKERERLGDALQAEDIANAILYAVKQPKHVSINEVLVRPTQQRT